MTTIPEGADAKVGAAATMQACPSGICPPVFADSWSEVDFYFELNGPANSSALLDFAASGFLSQKGDQFSYAESEFMVEGGLPSLFNPWVSTCGDNGYGTKCGASQFDKAVEVPTGNIYRVSVLAQCEAEAMATQTTSGSATCNAETDPMIQIDPSVNNAQDYSLAFSPNVPALLPPQQPQPAPEPPSIILLASGLLGLGILRRRAH